MQKEKTDYLKMLRGGEKLTFHQQLLMILSLSIPGMLAQLSTIAMEYIDAVSYTHLTLPTTIGV